MARATIAGLGLVAVKELPGKDPHSLRELEAVRVIVFFGVPGAGGPREGTGGPIPT